MILATVTFLFIYLFIYLLPNLFIYQFYYQPIYLFIYLLSYLLICLLMIVETASFKLIVKEVRIKFYEYSMKMNSYEG